MKRPFPILLLWLIGCAGNEIQPSAADTAPNENTPPVQVDAGIRAELEITAYYLHPELDYLVPVKRTIFSTDNPIVRIKQIVEVLSIPPDPDEGLVLWPSAIYLREVYMVEGHVLIDFDSATFERMSSGTSRELFMVYSLVDTLYKNIETCTGVRILVDGRPRDTLLGQVDIENVLHQRVSIILQDEEPEIDIQDL